MNGKSFFFSKLQRYAKPKSRIVDIGVEIPAHFVSNEELAQQVHAPEKLKRKLPGLIERTTGNKLRSYAPKGTCPSDLAAAAVFDLVKRRGLDLADVDTLIFSSTDMDMMEPATANILQDKLGLKLVNAFDLSNACNSFLQAMNVGNSLIASGAAAKVLVCSGEMGSAVANKELADVTELRVKMGGLTIADGGAALLLEPADEDGRGLYEINLLSLGEHWRLCHVPEREDWRQRGGAVNPWFYLDMPELAKVARRYTLQYFKEYDLLRAEMRGAATLTDSLDFFIPHQISRRMLEQIFNKTMKLDPEKVVITAHLYGNTASTAIPLALRWLMDNDRLTLGAGQDCFLYGAASGFGLGHIRLRL